MFNIFSAVRAAARMAISKGYIPFLFYNGFTGVANADGFICTWRGVANWAHQGKIPFFLFNSS